MPPKGTAGLARSAVSGSSRLPSPPASTIAKTLGEPVRLAMDCSLLPGRPRAYARRRTSVHEMRVDILSKEYPPQVYGGAGVHVAELVRALRARGDIDAQVRCFGGPRDEVGTTGYADLPQLSSANAAISTLGVDLAMVGDCHGADLVHSHTWYANMAGHLASLLGGVPHVVSAHSLELGVYAVVDVMGPGRVNCGVAAQNIQPHSGAHRDDCCRALVGRPLSPGGHRIPTAELLGLPRTHRLQAVCGHHVRHPAQQRGQMPGHVGVPGVRVDQVRAVAITDHGQVDAQGRDGRVGRRELGQIGIPGGAHLIAWPTEAADLGIDVPPGAQGSHQLSHVDASATVDLWWVLLGQDVDSHVMQASPAPGSSRDRRGPRLRPWLTEPGPPMFWQSCWRA